MKHFENLIEVKPYRSSDDNMWYFMLVYEYMDEKGKHNMIYPKVSIPFSQYRIPYVGTSYSDNQDYFVCEGRIIIFKGTSDLAASKGCSDTAYAFDIITEPAEPTEMTMEEIEEKLGYKVKIVSKQKE